MRRPFQTLLLPIAILVLAFWGIANALGAEDPRPRSFQIQIEGIEPDAKLRQVLEHEARSAESFAASWFHQPLEALVTLEWATHSGPLQRYGWSGSQTIAGLAVPTESRIVLFAPALSSRPDRIRSVLLHEMVHLHVHAATARADLSPPRWLDEGLAMWISGTWDLGFDWRSNESSLLTDASAAGTLLPFEKLDSSFPEGPFFALAYAQSYSFVSWLTEQHGEDSLRSLLRGLDRNLSFNDAFAAATGTSFPDAERDWRRSIERRGIFGFLPSSQALWIFGTVLVGLLMLVRFIQVRRRLAQPEERQEEIAELHDSGDV
jgi:hypothetical protein